ncbi:MAG: alpha/beta fold hydrolase [Anaerolineaceae bacterium]
MTTLIWVLIVLTVIIMIYLAVGSVAALTLTKIGDHPQYEQNPGRFGVDYESVQFKARGEPLQIAGWYLPNPDATRAMILVHGRNASKQNAISGNLSALAAELHRAGMGVLMIDLRGHGESEGKRYTFGAQERRDVLGAVDFLLGQGFAPGLIGALGISLGGAAVIGAAADEPAIGVVVLESTFADINALIEPNWKEESGLPMFFLPGVFWMWRVLIGFDLRSVKPVEELARVPPRPILILHSRQDRMVDCSQAQALKDAVSEARLVLFEDCDHAELFRDQPEAYLEALTPFLKEHWKG